MSATTGGKMNASLRMLESTEVATVTPKMAADWLRTMVANRPVSQTKAVEYGLAMERGDWILNGETIKFDEKGNLIDGQHRLQASVLSGKPFKTYVVRGISDPNAFATIDTGKIRSHADIFALSGIVDQNNASATANLLYLVKAGVLTMNGPAQARMKKMVNGQEVTVWRPKTPDRQELIAFALPMKDRIVEALRLIKRHGFKKMAPTSVLAAAYILFFEKNEAEAARFMQDLAEGAGLKTTDPVHRLRERLISNLGGVAKLSRWAVFMLIVKTWNKRRSGEPCGTLKLMDGEAFPKVK